MLTDNITQHTIDSARQAAESIRPLLTEKADQFGKESGFIWRCGKLTGASFAQILTFTGILNPQATLEEYAEVAAVLDVSISPQGLAKRFTAEAALYLKHVLAEATKAILRAQPVQIPLLERFTRVDVLDGSIIELPAGLKKVWQGCGGTSDSLQAALKLHVRLELKTGELGGPHLGPGREHDQQSPCLSDPLPDGALEIRDLGFFNLKNFRTITDQHAYFLSRLKVGTLFFDQTGRRWSIGEFLKRQKGSRIEIPIELGAIERLPCRLMTLRWSEKKAAALRRHLKDDARRKQQPLSEAQLAMADWLVLVTNAPEALMNIDEAVALMRARWQIELLFKLWKGHGRIDEWRTENPQRILCEIYARLLGLVIQHWILLVSCWAYPDRSLTKAIKTIQAFAMHLLVEFKDEQALKGAILLIKHCLARGCRINKRKAQPSTFQMLQQPALATANPEEFEQPQIRCQMAA